MTNATALRLQRKADALAIVKAGAPKHPLYIKSGTPLEIFA